MFENLRAAVNAHYDAAAEKFAADLETLTARAALDSWYWRDRMTAAAFEMVKSAAAEDGNNRLPEAARVKMFKRFNRENETARADRLEKIERAAAADPLRDADIVVDWHKSRMWGYNPSARVTVNGRRITEGTASGCGYDKESAAIATALNASPVVMRALYEHAERGGVFPYSVHVWAGLPSFDGGCGVSCFRSVFDAVGYEWADVAHGRCKFDVYRLSKKGV